MSIDEPTATPAARFHDRYATPIEREISPGFFVLLRRLSLTAELMRGALPNHVLQYLLWDDDDEEEQPIKQRYQAKYAGYAALAVRALVYPRLVLPEELERRATVENPKPQPDYANGEIGIGDLNYVELYNIWFYAIKEVVPPIGSAPFPAGADATPGSGELAPAGENVSPDAERVPAGAS